MTTKLAAEAESLYQTATRLLRVGLVVDRTALSPAQRRGAFALQCLAARCPESDEAKRPPSASPTRTHGSPQRCKRTESLSYGSQPTSTVGSIAGAPASNHGPARFGRFTPLVDVYH